MERQNGMDELKWYAAKIIDERTYVLKYLELEGVRVERISDIPSLAFLRCTYRDMIRIRYELYGKLYVYRSAGSKEPDPVPDNVMQTFLLLAPFHSQPVIYLAVDDPSFFQGQRKRVKAGPFKGCEGILKRIKGDRRLIVKISDHAAVATPYIKSEDLEDIE